MILRRVDMKAPVGFLVLVLCCGRAQAQTENPKCKLKTIFEDMQKDHPVQGLPEDVMAKLVCHAELASGFNPSTVKTLTPGTGGNAQRRKRGSGGIFDLAMFVDPTTTTQPQTTTQNQNRRRRRSTGEEVWTLYGYFQLSNHVVCTDEIAPKSLNMCNMKCSDLGNNDLEDDVKCVLDICHHIIQRGWANADPDLIRMLILIFQDECRDKTYAEYFAECVAP